MRRGEASRRIEGGSIISRDESTRPGPEGETARRGARPGMAAFRLRSPAHLVALGFGSGLFPVGPGTVGTLWSWCVFVLLEDVLLPVEWAGVIAAAFLAGVWACGRTAREVGVADHSAIVWDEVVAFWIVLLVVPSGWLSQLIAFVLFRFFDIVKPPPIGFADAQVRGGFGIMLDDLIAAFFTLLVFACWRALFG